MSERNQRKRWRCLTVGCNPVLNETTAAAHAQETGHRVAKWPVRSRAGKAKAKQRNRSGYYDKYNVGEKSYEARGLGRGMGLSPEDMSGDGIGQWMD